MSDNQTQENTRPSDTSTEAERRILTAIHERGVIMRPRWHFILRTAFVTTGVVFAAFTLLYLTSFIIFILRETGVWFTPGFGLRGWQVFFFAFPWWLLLACGVLLVIAERLLRHYAFSYRQPLLFSVGAMVLMVLITGVVFGKSGLHGQMLDYFEDHRVPVARDFYSGFGLQHFDEVRVGALVATSADRFLIEDRRENEVPIMIDQNTSLPSEPPLAVGDVVVVFGDPASGTIRAMTIRKVEDDLGPGKKGMRRALMRMSPTQ